MEEKVITEQESLNLINRMIHEAKGYYYENGLSALIYGFCVFSCSILSFMIERGIIRFSISPFYLLVPVFFVQFWIQNKQDKEKKAKTFTDETIDYVWVGFFLSSIVSLSALFAGLNYLVISIILLLVGFACFLTGMITKFRYHIISSFICFLLTGYSFFIPNENSYLLLAAVAIIVWIIPGFILRSKFMEMQKKKKD